MLTSSSSADVELVGGDLAQRRQNALTELDLAREDGDAAIRVDADPTIERAVVIEAAGQFFRRLLGKGERPGEAEADNYGAGAESELAAGETGAHSDASLAARRIARMIRPCVPQRQRLPASAARIAASSGSGFWSSNALAPMIMPAMQ